MKKREVKTTVFASRFSLFRAADCRPCGIPGRAGIAASGCAVARNDRGGRPCGVPAMPVGEGLAPPAGTRVSKQKRPRANAHTSAFARGPLVICVPAAGGKPHPPQAARARFSPRAGRAGMSGRSLPDAVKQSPGADPSAPGQKRFTPVRSGISAHSRAGWRGPRRG